MARAAALSEVTRPSGSVTITPSPMLRRVVCSSSFSAASASWARRSSVTSRKTITTPSISPDGPLIGAALSAIGVAVPSRESSAVWLASPTTPPSRRTRATGFSAGRPVSSFTMSKTSVSSRPEASPSGQPVSRSATPFMN